MSRYNRSASKHGPESAKEYQSLSRKYRVSNECTKVYSGQKTVRFCVSAWQPNHCLVELFKYAVHPSPTTLKLLTGEMNPFDHPVTLQRETLGSDIHVDAIRQSPSPQAHKQCSWMALGKFPKLSICGNRTCLIHGDPTLDWTWICWGVATGHLGASVWGDGHCHRGVPLPSAGVHSL